MHDKTRAALWNCNSASYKITSEGLEISIDRQTRQTLRKLQLLEEGGEPVGFHTDELFLELIEHCLGNGLSTVQPEHIGALTSSIILCEGNILDDHGEPVAALIAETKCYWYANYQIRSPIEDLVAHSKVIFTE